ncbi:MAG: purine-cytosine permease family protein [Micrococcales bacterium]
MANNLEVEQHGLNVIPESERHGQPKDQFWPWAASNVSIFGISMAAWILGFGLSFGEAVVAGLVGIVFSFALVGLIALAGKRGSAPTLVLSRAAFGVNGNALPTLVSYLLLVGWEIVLVALGVLATSTVFTRLGWGSGDVQKVVIFLVIIAIVVTSGIFGFKFIMRIQKWITLASVVLTVVFIALSAHAIDFSKVNSVPAGGAAVLTAGIVYAMTAFGLGWVNGGADYSRYLPRTASSKGIFGWTTFGAAIAPAILVIYGFLLAMSDDKIRERIGGDPIGAISSVLPTWFLIPYIVLALLGFMGGAILDIYSSGLNLLTLGFKLKRYQAAGIDGIFMILGTIYFVWIAGDFFWPFQAGLYILGVPMAAWAGIFIADLALRKKSYDEAALYDAKGRYGSVNVVAVGTMIVAMIVGYGFISSPDTSLGFTTWEGYLYGLFGITGDNSPWYYSNIGVFLALAIGFVGQYLLGRKSVERQEA